MAARNRKCHLEEVEKFDEIADGIPNANVYGVLTSISPVKKGRTQTILKACSLTDKIK